MQAEVQKNLIVSKLFLTGIFISSIACFPFILDFTLTPRFISLAILLLLATIAANKVITKTIVDTNIILISYFTFTVWCALSFFWSNTKSEALFEIFKCILALLTFLFTYFSLKQNKIFFFESVYKISVTLPAIGLTFALYQYSTIEDFNKEWIYSITGINGHKNLYSSFLYLNTFFLILASLNLERIWKLLSVISLIVSLALIIFLHTKAVWIGSSVSILLFLFLRYLYPKLNKIKIKIKIKFIYSFATIIIFANIFFLFFLPKIVERGIDYNSNIPKASEIHSQKTELDNERLLLWKKTFQLIEENKTKGVGMGNWQINFPKNTLTGLWRAEDLNYTFQRPHNDWLWILSETGIIGFNLFLFFICSILLMLFKCIDFKNKESTKIILLISFITGFLIISFFDFPKERIEHLVWINIILAIAYYFIKTNGAVKSIFQIKIKPLHLIITILVLVFAFIGGILRCKGEYYTRQIYEDKVSGNYFGVIQAADKAGSFIYTVDPTSIPLLWYTGNANVSLGNFSKAFEEFKKAYEINPFNRNVINDMASAYSVNKNNDLAKQFYLEASRISPRFDDPKLNLASIYINEKNYKKANECLQSMVHDSEKRINYQKMIDYFLAQERDAKK